MKDIKELEFKVSIEDANIILNALSKQPFEQVAKLINQITNEAQEQLNPVKE